MKLSERENQFEYYNFNWFATVQQYHCAYRSVICSQRAVSGSSTPISTFSSLQKVLDGRYCSGPNDVVSLASVSLSSKWLGTVTLPIADINVNDSIHV